MKKIFLFLTLLSAYIGVRAQSTQCVSAALVGPTNIELSIKQTGTAPFDIGTNTFYINMGGLVFVSGTTPLPSPFTTDFSTFDYEGVTYLTVNLYHNSGTKSIGSSKEVLANITVSGSGTPVIVNPTTIYNVNGDEIVAFCPVVLSAELLSFTAEQVGEQSSVKWSTVKEKDLRGYAVQRSIDGVNFKTLESVAPTGKDVTSVASYNLIDEKPELGVNYYRLQMSDLNGDVKYSKIVSVDFGSRIKGKTYPNPFSTDLSIEIDIEKNIKGEVTIEVVDMLGKVVQAKKLVAEGRRVSVNLPTDGLSSGTYFIRMKSGNDVWQQKITKH